MSRKSSKKAKLVKEIRGLESKARRSRVELYKLAIDAKIKKTKPGENVFCVLGWGEVPSAICDALRKIYTKEGWKVGFPMDSRGDGGYIELSK
jgi:hypothetical protein